MRIVVIFICLGLLMSCGKDETGDIRSYIEDNNLTGFQETEDGLFYKIDVAGDESNKPKIGNDVVVHYRGYLTNGEEFDNSFLRGEPLTTNLTNVVPGWRLGIPFYGEGGKGTIIIPPSLGYDDNPPPGGSIPEGAILIFDIEVVDVP